MREKKVSEATKGLIADAAEEEYATSKTPLETSSDQCTSMAMGMLRSAIQI